MIYELSLSNNKTLQISERDLLKIKSNIAEKFIEVEFGIVNPSFIVSIRIDEEATKKENLELSKTVKEIDFNQMDFIRENLYSNDIASIKKVNSLLNNKPIIYENR